MLERLRVREQVHHHRRHVVPVGAAMALDQLRRGKGIPARLDDDAAAGVDERKQAVDQPGDVKKRSGGERHGIRSHVLPDRRTDDVVQDRRMRVHAALRPPGAARGVGHHAQVAGLRDGRRGFAPRRERVVPGSCRRRRSGARSAGRRTAPPLPRRQWPLSRRCRRRSARVPPAMFIGLSGTTTASARRIAKQATTQLRAVLHVEDHAVAALYAAGPLQMAGKCVDLLAQFPVAQHRAEMHRRRLVRMAQRSSFQQGVDGRARRGEAAREVRRPEAEVARFHGREV